MRRPLVARIAEFRRFGQLLQPAFEPRQLVAAPLEFRVQTDERLVHLLQIVLQVGHRGFQAENAIVGLGSGHGGENHRSKGESLAAARPILSNGCGGVARVGDSGCVETGCRTSWSQSDE